MAHVPPFTNAEGIAALGICESLLIALTEQKVLTEKSAHDVLADVVTTHTDAATQSPTPERHRAVVEVIERILSGKNGALPRD
jgi:hypothetical protein